MNLGLSGKVAVVTGASRGIGKAIALAFAQEEVKVALCARGKDALLATAREIAQKGGNAEVFPLDVRRPEGIRCAIGQILCRWGVIDILVNNAGGPLGASNFLDLSDARWQATIDLNLLSVIRLCREVIPSMQRRQGGRIINIASVAGRQIGPSLSDYGVAKSAVLSLTKYLALEFARENIKVNAVTPGAVWTSSWESEAVSRAARDGLPLEEATRRLIHETSAGIPLGRMGDPDDIAALVLFLASERSGWITGSCFTIDGGTVKSVY